MERRCGSGMLKWEKPLAAFAPAMPLPRPRSALRGCARHTQRQVWGIIERITVAVLEADFDRLFAHSIDA